MPFPLADALPPALRRDVMGSSCFPKQQKKFVSQVFCVCHALRRGMARAIVDAGGSLATLLRAALWTRGASAAISVRGSS